MGAVLKHLPDHVMLFIMNTFIVYQLLQLRYKLYKQVSFNLEFLVGIEPRHINMYYCVLLCIT